MNLLIILHRAINNFSSKAKDSKIVKSIFYPAYKLFGIGTLRESLQKKIYYAGAEETLHKIKYVLDSLNIHFWLEFGTLLGVVRNNDFLKHDIDIDLGLFLNDYTPELHKKLEEEGFKKVVQFETEDKIGLEQSYSYKDVRVDLFYFSENCNNRWCYVFFEDNNIFVPIANYFPKSGFRKIIFKNETFNIPDPPDKHLAYHYGQDFNTPKKNWDYVKDALNTEIIRGLKVFVNKYI